MTLKTEKCPEKHDNDVLRYLDVKEMSRMVKKNDKHPLTMMYRHLKPMKKAA